MPTFIATGTDGNVWLTEELGNNIVQLDPDNPGEQTEFPLITEVALPVDTSPGPDGNLWFTELAGRHVGKITPDGTITEYRYGEFGIAGVAASPSRNSLWFTENDSGNVSEISVNGVVGDILDTVISVRDHYLGPTGTCGIASGSAMRSEA